MQIDAFACWKSNRKAQGGRKPTHLETVLGDLVFRHELACVVDEHVQLLIAAHELLRELVHRPAANAQIQRSARPSAPPSAKTH